MRDYKGDLKIVMPKNLKLICNIIIKVMGRVKDHTATGDLF